MALREQTEWFSVFVFMFFVHCSHYYLYFYIEKLLVVLLATSRHKSFLNFFLNFDRSIVRASNENGRNGSFEARTVR